MHFIIRKVIRITKVIRIIQRKNWKNFKYMATYCLCKVLTKYYPNMYIIIEPHFHVIIYLTILILFYCSFYLLKTHVKRKKGVNKNLIILFIPDTITITHIVWNNYITRNCTLLFIPWVNEHNWLEKHKRKNKRKLGSRWKKQRRVET